MSTIYYTVQLRQGKDSGKSNSYTDHQYQYHGPVFSTNTEVLTNSDQEAEYVMGAKQGDKTTKR